MLIINCFGEPSAGKSTLASEIFSYFKKKGINIEYLQEYAKQKLYEDANTVFNCEPYIFGTQLYRQMSIANHADCLVTDSPILTPHFYEDDKQIKDMLIQLELAYFNKFDNFNIFIKRNHAYQNEGRFQSEAESKKINNDMRSFLDDNNIKYHEYCTSDSKVELFTSIEKEIYIHKGDL